MRTIRCSSSASLPFLKRNKFIRRTSPCEPAQRSFPHGSLPSETAVFSSPVGHFRRSSSAKIHAEHSTRSLPHRDRKPLHSGLGKGTKHCHPTLILRQKADIYPTERRLHRLAIRLFGLSAIANSDGHPFGKVQVPHFPQKSPVFLRKHGGFFAKTDGFQSPLSPHSLSHSAAS